MMDQTKEQINELVAADSDGDLPPAQAAMKSRSPARSRSRPAVSPRSLRSRSSRILPRRFWPSCAARARVNSMCDTNRAQSWPGLADARRSANA